MSETEQLTGLISQPETQLANSQLSKEILSPTRGQTQDQTQQSIINIQDQEFNKENVIGGSRGESHAMIAKDIKSALAESLGVINIQQNIVGQHDENDRTDEDQTRKVSFADSEVNFEEMMEDDVDIRRKINQKLIRNKNYFMYLMSNNNNQASQKEESSNAINEAAKVIQLIDKRSRSETPDKMSATEVLIRAHKKLQNRRKDSPNKLLEKHQQRQKKAVELRSQIEKSKKEWYEKIRNRQQVAKKRWKELLAERKAKLAEKLEHAEERRESEIQSLKNKAKQENIKIDETNYIVRMTMSNMKLDLDLKMNETQERRNHLMEEYKKKKHTDRMIKEEAAEKRRQELLKETENKFQNLRRRREEAEKRRIKMLEEKKKQAQISEQSRYMVIQRKTDLGYKISDVMSFVSNSETLWDYLANERDWQKMGLANPGVDDDLILQLISKDNFEIEKLQLKMDAELLNKLIYIDEDGSVSVNEEYLPLVKKKYDYFSGSSSDDEDSHLHDMDENEPILTFTPEKRGRRQPPPLQTQSSAVNHQSLILSSPLKSLPQEEESAEFIQTEGSESIPEENKNESNHEEDKSSTDGSHIIPVPDKYEELKSSHRNQNDSQSGVTQRQMKEEESKRAYESAMLTDEDQMKILQSQRLKMSMKRNVLKKNLSEDLTWAYFLKNEIYSSSLPSIFKNPAHTRSMQSTPERKQEIPCESDYTNEIEVQQVDVSQERYKSKKRSQNHNHNKNQGNGNNQQAVNASNSNANLSDGKRITSVVYPSKKKKNPKNAIVNSNNNQSLQHQNNSSQQQMTSGSGGGSSGLKKNSGGSNQSSTQSLPFSNSFCEGTSQLAQRKSTQIVETDSARKQRTAARMHSSSVQESQHSKLTAQVLGLLPNATLVYPQAQQVTGVNSSAQVADESDSQITSHTGTQMSQLIANSKPLMNKIIPKKLSANATKILFPIREQKLLMKRPGKEGQFGKCKIVVKMEDLLIKAQASAISTIMNYQANVVDNNSLIESNAGTQQLSSSLKTNNTEGNQETSQRPSSKHSTPSQQKRRESAGMPHNSSLNTNVPSTAQPSGTLQSSGSSQVIIQAQQLNQNTTGIANTMNGSNSVKSGLNMSQSQTSGSQSNILADQSVVSTPTQKTSKLLLIQQKFWEKYTTMHMEQQPEISQAKKTITQQSTVGEPSNMSPPIKKLKNLNSSQIKKEDVEAAIQATQGTPTGPNSQQTNTLNTSSSGAGIINLSPTQLISQPSPQTQDASSQQPQINTSYNIGTSIASTQIVPISTTLEQDLSAQLAMNEQGYKELIIKYLLNDNIQFLKTDDSQKTIAIEGPEADKLIDFLENHEFQMRFCRLCDLIIPEHCNNEAHTQQKAHKKTREELGIKESEDLQFSIISLHSIPGDIDKELLKEKEKALKRKVKRIKAEMIAKAVSHESAQYNPGKDYNSANKRRLQMICIDLEKQVIPIINNYETLESTLKEIIKILELRKQVDLHIMRKLKYIPILIEICKRISVCHKNEFKSLGKILEYVIKIINTFCALRENRNYMLQTNRMSALIELLNWCLNRPTQLFYAIGFMPTLIQILTLHVKHRAPYECQQMKEMFIEYMICSSITMKIKAKFQIINGPLDLSEMMGQVPLFLLKSATFLDSITQLLSIDSISRPVYEKSSKLGEHVLFVIQNTEMFGIIPMITTILLSRNQPFKPSQANHTMAITGSKVLPQTLVCLAITSIKILNNIMRMDYKFAQMMMSEFEIQEQLYHLFNYIIYYTCETWDQNEDSKELLNQTILLIGYLTLNNERQAQILCRGENTLLQKMCNLPFAYFCDKKLKDILFPTLISASYKNERCLAIIDQEISIDMLAEYIQLNLKEELPRIIEEMEDQQSISSLGAAQHVVDRRTRSPSQSSISSQGSTMQVIDTLNGTSPFLPLYMRFPKKYWKDSFK